MINFSRTYKTSPKINQRPKLFTAVAVVCVLWASPVFACGGIFDVECNLQHGGLSPENIGEQATKVGQDVGNALNELQASTLSGPVLEQAIIASYDSAIGTSSPIPQNIRQVLEGYSSEESLNRARYKVGDNGFLNLARLLEQSGFASAVTLDNLIIFIGPSEAADPSIWAHELVHVDQYSDGIHSFAVRYARNHNSIENPAYEKGNSYWAWRRQQENVVHAPSSTVSNSSSQDGQQDLSVQSTIRLPPGFIMQGCGCWGPAPPFMAPEPNCASGSVQLASCPFACNQFSQAYGYICQ